ncbi:MAG: ABC transporter permease [Lachnospiraceae bacterium]|nr:ABC transporter permease [Lachnospiraceae bacterium]
MKRNVLKKRFFRELKSEFGKYLVIFLFLIGAIGFVSGFLVASNSMLAAYDESFTTYRVEDGNFELSAPIEETLLATLEQEGLNVYENLYLTEEVKETSGRLRIFKNRAEVNLVCLMEGELPMTADEIAIDRMHADNNKLSVGDTLAVGDRTLKISGLVALSDYSALYEKASDMMFDATKFGVAVMTEEGFATMGDTHLHYSYSWRYDTSPESDKEATEWAEKVLALLMSNAMITGNAPVNFLPAVSNLAIQFVGDDMGRDNKMMAVFLYIIIAILAFVFAITISNTITKEALVIGTLRASGYTKAELIRHYLALPMTVVAVAAVVGNVLGYTVFKEVAAKMYYASYSLPTFVTLWNVDAFVRTTVIPVVMMFVINLGMLVRKISLSPLRFIRRDLSKRKKKKALRLNSKMSLMNRFRLRILLQNLPNYITILVGVFFANVLLLFGFVLPPLVDNYEKDITSNLIAEYQYVLKMSTETAVESAEKYSVTALQTVEGKLKSEEVMVYGVAKDSAYIDAEFGDGVLISTAYAGKHGLSVGDEITLEESFGEQTYTFTVAGVYEYPAALAVFMEQQEWNEIFGLGGGYFNGYFSDVELTDLDERLLATKITADDLTKTTRQLKVSMGELMDLFLVFGVAVFLLVIYLLSKLIIEKNAQSISMTKILGYTDGEINKLYVWMTSVVVVVSLIGTIPLVNYIMKYLFAAILADYPGWLPYSVPFAAYIRMAVLGIVAYAVVAFIQMRKVKGVSKSEALKAVE